MTLNELIKTAEAPMPKGPAKPQFRSVYEYLDSIPLEWREKTRQMMGVAPKNMQFNAGTPPTTEQQFGEVMQRSPWVAQQMGSMPGATTDQKLDAAIRVEHYGATQAGAAGANRYAANQQQQDFYKQKAMQDQATANAAGTAEVMRPQIQQQMALQRSQEQARNQKLNELQAGLDRDRQERFALQQSQENARNQKLNELQAGLDRDRINTQNQMAQQMQSYSDWYKSPEREFMEWDRDVYKPYAARREQYPDEIRGLLQDAQNENLTSDPNWWTNTADPILFKQYGDDYLPIRKEWEDTHNAAENEMAATRDYLAQQINEFYRIHGGNPTPEDLRAFEGQVENDLNLPKGSFERILNYSPVMFPEFQRPEGYGTVEYHSNPKEPEQVVQQVEQPAPVPQPQPQASPVPFPAPGSPLVNPYFMFSPDTMNRFAQPQVAGNPPATTGGNPQPGPAGNPNNPSGKPGYLTGGQVGSNGATTTTNTNQQGNPQQQQQESGVLAWMRQNPNTAAAIAALLAGGLFMGGSAGSEKSNRTMDILLALLLGGGAFFGTKHLLKDQDPVQAVAQQAGNAAGATKAPT